MTIEEHIRAAEHHMTEAYALMLKNHKSRLLAAHPEAWERIMTLMLNVLGLCGEIKRLKP